MPRTRLESTEDCIDRPQATHRYDRKGGHERSQYTHTPAARARPRAGRQSVHISGDITTPRSRTRGVTVSVVRSKRA
eukprot:466447-Prymnesium_polylepis.1